MLESEFIITESGYEKMLKSVFLYSLPDTEENHITDARAVRRKAAALTIPLSVIKNEQEQADESIADIKNAGFSLASFLNTNTVIIIKRQLKTSV
jgi:hypothetical protein